MPVMGKESCSISSLITRNVDMAWNPAQSNTFSRICKSTIILQDFLYQIYFQFKSAQSLQDRHRVREDDEVLISTATDNVKCQADCVEFCSKDACFAWYRKRTVLHDFCQTTTEATSSPILAWVMASVFSS